MILSGRARNTGAGLAESVGIAESDTGQSWPVCSQHAEGPTPGTYSTSLPPENKNKTRSLVRYAYCQLQQFVSETLIRAVIAQREIKEERELQEMDKAVSISTDMHLACHTTGKARHEGI